jgi:spermidine/putrescine-binding protein
MMRVSKWVLGMTAAVGLTFGAVGSASADGELHLYNWSNYL